MHACKLGFKNVNNSLLNSMCLSLQSVPLWMITIMFQSSCVYWSKRIISEIFTHVVINLRLSKTTRVKYIIVNLNGLITCKTATLGDIGSKLFFSNVNCKEKTTVISPLKRLKSIENSNCKIFLLAFLHREPTLGKPTTSFFALWLHRNILCAKFNFNGETERERVVATWNN